MHKMTFPLSLAFIAVGGMALAQTGGAASGPAGGTTGTGSSRGSIGVSPTPGVTTGPSNALPGSVGTPGSGTLGNGPGAAVGINGSPAVTGPAVPNVGVTTNPAVLAVPGSGPNTAGVPSCPPGTGVCTTLPGAQQ